MSTMENEFLTIGKITKNQGNKGEVRVIPFTDYPERYELLKNVYLNNGSERISKKIENIWYHKKFVIIKFKDIDNIGQALELKDYMIEISAEERLPLEENEYYINDIIGYKVFTLEDELLGTLIRVDTTGGTDLFIVKGKNREYMIPAAKEIITKIDSGEQSIQVKPIPGLLDL